MQRYYFARWKRCRFYGYKKRILKSKKNHMSELNSKVAMSQGLLPQRRALLKTLMVVTSVGGALFFIINTRRGLYLLANLELAVGLASVGLYFVIGRTQRLFLWTTVYLFPFLCIMMLAMMLPRTSPTVFLWIYIVPILCHLGRSE